MQSALPLPTGGIQQLFIPASNLLPAAYQHARSRLSQAKENEDFFLLEPNSIASMLFDCDPESCIEFASVAVSLDASGQPQIMARVPIQKINLENVRFTGGAQGILANVTGKWGGAIYSRAFDHPEGKPYLFLGRGRVLIKPSSKLDAYLRDLNGRAQFTKMADTIALLLQDLQGYPPPELEVILIN